MHLSYSHTTLSITSNCSLAPQHQLACPTSIQERRWFGETAGRSTDRRKAPLVRPPAGALRCWPACWWALSSTWGLRPLWPSPCWTPGPECSPWASRTPAGDTAGEETNYKKKKTRHAAFREINKIGWSDFVAAKWCCYTIAAAGGWLRFQPCQRLPNGFPWTCMGRRAENNLF